MALLDLPPLLKTLLERGWIGRKAGGGFYRLHGPDKQRQALDLSTLDYRPQQKVDLASARARTPVELLAGDDAGAAFARSLLGYALTYTATVAPEIAGDVLAIDTAMREGYSWRWGPFELLDQIGLAGFVDAPRGRWPAGAGAAANGAGQRRRTVLSRGGRRPAVPRLRRRVSRRCRVRPARWPWPTCAAPASRCWATPRPACGTWATAWRCSNSTPR